MTIKLQLAASVLWTKLCKMDFASFFVATGARYCIYLGVGNYLCFLYCSLQEEAGTPEKNVKLRLDENNRYTDSKNW